MPDMVISVDDFTNMQTQILEYKNQNYDLQDRLKMATTEADKLRKANTALDKELTKLKDTVNKSKSKTGVAEMQHEIDQLKLRVVQAREEAQEANHALRENLRAVYEENGQLKDQVKLLKGAGGASAPASAAATAENTALHAEIDKLKASEASATKSLAEIKEQLEAAKKEAQAASTALKQKELSLQQAQAQVQQYQSQLQTAQEATRRANGQLVAAQSERARLSEQLAQARAEVDHLKMTAAAAPPAAAAAAATAAAPTASTHSDDPFGLLDGSGSGGAPAPSTTSAAPASAGGLIDFGDAAPAQTSTPPATGNVDLLGGDVDLLGGMGTPQSASTGGSLHPAGEAARPRPRVNSDVGNTSRLYDQIAALESKLAKTEGELLTLQTHCDELTAKLAETQLHHDQAAQQAELSVGEHSAKLAEAEKRIETLNHELEQLKEQQKHNSEAATSATAATAKTAAVEAQLVALKASHAEETAKHQKDLAAAKADTERIIQKIGQKEQEILRLREQVENHNRDSAANKLQSEAKITKERDDAIKEKDAATKQVKDLKDELASTKKTRDTLQAQAKENQAKIVTLEDENKARTTKEKSMQEAIAKITADLEAARQVTTITADELKSQRRLVAELEGKLSDANSRVTDLEDENTALTLKLDAINQSVNKTQALYNDTVLAVQRLEEDNQKLESAKKKLEVEVKELTARHETAAAEAEDREQTMQTKIAALQKTIDSKNKSIQEAEEQCKLAQQEIDQLKTQLVEAEQRQLTAAAQWSEEKASYEQRCKSLEDAAEEQRQRANETEQKMADMSLEQKIASRKTQQMIKELKAELAKQQGRPVAAEPASISPAAGAGQVAKERSVPTLSRSSSSSSDLDRLAHHNADTVKVDGSDVPASVLLEERRGMLQRLEQLQEDKWRADEKLKNMNKDLAALGEEVDKKSKIIQYYINRERGRAGTQHSGTTAAGSSAAHPSVKVDGAEDEGDEKKGRFRKAMKMPNVANVFRKNQGEGAKEHQHGEDMSSTMQSVVEEALLKNIQLQQDLSTMGAEIDRLIKENRQLKGLPESSRQSSASSSPAITAPSTASSAAKPEPKAQPQEAAHSRPQSASATSSARRASASSAGGSDEEEESIT